MAEVWDLAQYVEENPNDYEQRWRLAKKLYKAWEYRHALEHLQILRKDWEPRLNVVRYLAATYYRLGRYDEAVAELRDGISAWPQELGLREQLARVLEVAGDRLGAAEVWQTIAELDPHHPIAESAVKRLRDKRDGDARSDLNLHVSDAGIDLAPGRVCRNCGAQNSDDAERCWQCQAPLFTIRPTPRPAQPAAEPRHSAFTLDTLVLVLGLLTVGALSAGVYLTVKEVFGAEPEAPLSLGALFRGGLLIPRIVTAAVLFVAWPVALWLALSFVTDRIAAPAALVNLTGVLSTAFLFAASWISSDMFLGAIGLTALLTLAVVAGALRLPFPKALAAWAAQYCIVAGVALLVFVGAVKVGWDIWINPLSEFSAARAYVSEHPEGDGSGTLLLEGTTPYNRPLVWSASGSRWIDAAAGEVTFVVKVPPGSSEMKFEIQDAEGTVYFDKILGTEFRKTLGVTTGRPYTLIVDGTPGTNATIEIQSLIQPTLR